jgi:magnesium-transporting ATPase (P-type)
VPLIALIVALLVVCALGLATPLLLLLRYRAGTARRLARPWVLTVNLLSMLLSAGLFIWIAALTNFWVPRAFGYSLIGMVSGCLLGLLGLAATRWEKTGTSVYYTPNRWLVLLVTVAVATRMIYGVWRIWHAWRTTGADTSWLAAAAIPGSMAVGALVVGYYLTYFAGVRWRLRS